MTLCLRGSGRVGEAWRRSTRVRRSPVVGEERPGAEREGNREGGRKVGEIRNTFAVKVEGERVMQ